MRCAANLSVALSLCALLQSGCGETPDAGPEPSVLPIPIRADSEVLALLPDTQYYSLRYPELFTLQTSWLADHAERLAIRYVLHLGDLVDTGTPLEWERASLAMALLDGVVPYAIVPGNHDYGPGGTATTRETLLNDWFSYAVQAEWPSFGGAYVPGRLDNTYHLFEAQGRAFILLALEWGPRAEVIDWANQVMAAHPERDGILLTHAYLNHNDRRYDYTDTRHTQRYNPHEYDTPGVHDGEELWQLLVRHHRFVMTFNGHVLGDGTGYLVSQTDRGNDCHQMLINYQMRPEGGGAYLRLLELRADGETVVVHSYSPLHDDLLQEPDQRFEFVLD